MQKTDEFNESYRRTILDDVYLSIDNIELYELLVSGLAKRLRNGQLTNQIRYPYE
jgi:hypothetical protein